MPEAEKDNSNFWNSFIRAVEAEPRDAKPLRGASGLFHPVVAIGVDDARRRLVVISGDPDARSAALAQADIQASIPSLKVVLARPIAVNLSAVANALVNHFGRVSFDLKSFPKWPKTGKRKQQRDLELQTLLGDFGKIALGAIGHAPLSAVAAWQDVILQLSHIEFNANATPVVPSVDANNVIYSPFITLGGLIALDPAESDRRAGICSVPLYSLTEEDAEVFHRGSDLDQVRQIMCRLDMLQYFFPPPDQLALALVDSHLASPSSLVANLQLAPDVGHPFGETEIVTVRTPVEQIIDALQAKGLCVEGELGYELTEQGQVSRGVVRFKPREGLLAKLSRVLSLKVDVGLKDLFK